MWQQQPDYAQYKEKSGGEGWLVNRQEGMLLQIKPDTPTQHAPVHPGELLPLVSSPRAAAQAAANAQASRHRDVDQLAEDRLATLLSA